MPISPSPYLQLGIIKGLLGGLVKHCRCFFAFPAAGMAAFARAQISFAGPLSRIAHAGYFTVQNAVFQSKAMDVP